jgi:hypothetical protein
LIASPRPFIAEAAIRESCLSLPTWSWTAMIAAMIVIAAAGLPSLAMSVALVTA